MGGLSDKVRLEKVQGSTLVLGVFEASWMQELYLLSPTLIKTINNHLGEAHVKELRFKSAAQKKIRVEKKEAAEAPQPQQARAMSTNEQTVLAQITDPQLRSVLQDYLTKCDARPTTRTKAPTHKKGGRS